MTRIIFAVLALLLLSACGPTPEPRSPEPSTLVEVDNQMQDRVIVYVVREGTRVQRLGDVPMHTQARLPLPSRYLDPQFRLEVCLPFGRCQIAEGYYRGHRDIPLLSVYPFARATYQS